MVAMANDIEMARVGATKKGGPPEETDYRPVNWRRIFLTPKYIRALPDLSRWNGADGI
jgi:hypothetical protein